MPDNCEFTGHSTSMGPPNGTCFMSPFWHTEFGGNSYIFGKLVDLCIWPDLKKQKYYETSITQQRLLHIPAATAANVVDQFPTLQGVMDHYCFQWNAVHLTKNW